LGILKEGEKLFSISMISAVLNRMRKKVTTNRHIIWMKRAARENHSCRENGVMSTEGCFKRVRP